MSMAITVSDLYGRIKKSKDNNRLSSHPVTLLGASKGQPAAIIRETIEAGISDFGENRVQEAESKWPPLQKAFPRVRLHMIGPLQTNKVRQTVALFDVIQTLDRVKLADALSEEMARASKTLSCFIQVNIGKEPQKAGVMPEEAGALIRYCKEQLALPVVGLMCVPPDHQPPAPYFALLRQIAGNHGLTELSMGMSGDFETAVRMGSSCVRLGRVLFGERSA